ncbi:MAG: hypothetical protein HYZ50_08755 [Deltaproteobacteria bacterium]|nr:hypothetical protein [Deltaproteobacteria bacterium]
MEVTALVSATKIAYDIAKGMAALKSEVERNEAISKILQVLISVQKEALAMQSEHALLAAKVRKLEQENLRLQDWSAEKTRYVRQRISGGAFVYTEQNPVDTPEETYKLCCSCFENTIKSPLQAKRVRHAIHFVCPHGCPDLEIREWNNKFS